jgi:hypothetical protein
MKILENEILVQFDEEHQQIVTYRAIEGSPEKVLHTIYLLSEIQSKGIGESERLIGEDILISLKGTREKFFKEEVRMKET